MDEMHFVEAPNNFYLGAKVDPDTHEIITDDIVYYDARDLTTHGVILGMTGSGKTGLGIAILEEAVIDGIPCLVIDPKGDITNMLLAFPDLEPQYFLPWISPEDAERAEHSIEEQAAVVAQRWREGLASWGIANERIQEYRRAARFSIYTPGSEAGLPVSILQSLAAPKVRWDEQQEMLRERISGTVSAILALIGISARPVEDKEHILLSNIFEHNWRNNTDLSMEQLIIQVQRPPFSKLGVLDLDSVISEKDRLKLSQALNNIIAAPNFQSWIKGEALHIPSMLFTPEGYPRTTIFYTAHLNDAERQFITTLLLESIHSWMRSLSGSTSLRALVFIDEAVGMFPPHPYNPPTKEPLMRLLKQGRAFGVGILVATQNPKDVDYKGLSNAGTWLIGKLQTENDKERVLEGLDSARDATSALDIGVVDKLIGRLGPREFILHNVHEPNTPILMHTRWVMSYMRGPLTRLQISQLMDNQREISQQEQVAQQQQYNEPSHRPAAAGAMPQQPGPAAAQPVIRPRASLPAGEDASAAAAPAPPQQVSLTDDLPAGFVAMPPSLGSSVEQYYLPVEYTIEQAIFNWEQWNGQQLGPPGPRRRVLYRPSVLAQTIVRFSHRQTGTAETYTYAFIMPTLPRALSVDWGQFVSTPFDPQTLEIQPLVQGFYAKLSDPFRQTAGFTSLRDSLVDWIYYNAALYAYHNPVLKMYSQIDEDQRSFIARMQAVAREERDKEVDTVASRYDSRLDRLEERYRRQALRLDATREEMGARKREEMLTAGESLWQLMRGRAYYTLSRTSRMRRYTSSSQDRLGIVERDIQQIVEQFNATEQEMEQALQEVQEKWANAVRQIEEIRISPLKKDITVSLFGIGWVPYWDVLAGDTPLILPATSSTLAASQEQEQHGASARPGAYSPI